MRDNPRYVVTLIYCDDGPVAAHYSAHTLATTLRLASGLVRGVPQTEVCVRRAGRMVAYMHTDWRGRLDEVEVYSPVSSRVTPMNPAADMFETPA